MNLGMDVTVSQHGHDPTQAQLFCTIQNLCTVMAGAKPVSVPIEIQSEATNIKSYSFSLSNGDRLLALWTDGVAVDADPGIEATLTLPGFSAQKVVGIDVLHGFEQELITNVEDGNLVICNLLVKDYPIMLRLTPADILSYYRSYSGDPNVVELSDLVKAANDWLSGQAPPGFDNPITLPQLVQLANEWLAG